MSDQTPTQGWDDPTPASSGDDVGVDPAAPVIDITDPAGAAEPSASPAGEAVEDPIAAAQQEAAERTADLQRLQAEYLNYKRRVERDREVVAQNAVFKVLTPMLDVLDSIDRAKESGALEGGFKEVADQLSRVVEGLGLIRFGEPGDAFDPQYHDALSHVGTDPDATVVTCKHIVTAGYRIGERVMRAAQVLVVDPAEPADPPEPPGEAGPRPTDDPATND